MISALPDDLRLDPLGLLARRGLDRISRRSLQEAVRLGREVVGQGLEGVVGVDPEDEADVAGLSQRSRCSVWVKSVSPRRKIRWKPARRHRAIILSRESAACSCEGRLPLRLTR